MHVPSSNPTQVTFRDSEPMLFPNYAGLVEAKSTVVPVPSSNDFRE